MLFHENAQRPRMLANQTSCLQRVKSPNVLGHETSLCASDGIFVQQFLLLNSSIATAIRIITVRFLPKGKGGGERRE